LTCAPSSTRAAAVRGDKRGGRAIFFKTTALRAKAAAAEKAGSGYLKKK